MALKIQCPNCSRPHRLESPYPPPGSELQCTCGRVLALTFSPQAIKRIRDEGGTFLGEARRVVAMPEPGPHQPGAPTRSPEPALRPSPPVPPQAAMPRPPARGGYPSSLADGDNSSFPDPDERRTVVEREDMDEESPTVMEGAGSSGLLDEGLDEPDWGQVPAAPPRTYPLGPGAGRPAADPPTAATQRLPGRAPAPPPPPAPLPPAPRGRQEPGLGPRGAAPPPPPPEAPPLRRSASAPRGPAPRSPVPVRRRRARVLLLVGALLMILALVTGAVVLWYFSRDLPTLEALQDYRPPTVTLVMARDGRLLGEIYEQRRYVVELDEIPQHVRNAFLAAEDANFYRHGGVDPMGIARAMGRNLAKGRMAQGASTITQQVARNFLLSSEKKLERKIKEVILAWRIEESFTKDEVFWLYLNQIYLGSGAYGLEAASRIYFDKHVDALTVAEGALLAGLPQRPSDYSPHHSWAQARARQEYVLDQMLDKGFLDQAGYDAALAEQVRIVRTENPIRVLAPYFTEHVRRHLVENYGFDRVYNEGLVATTTCDLDLQQAAQRIVIEGVTEQDERLGWRGPLEHLEGEAAIQARLAAQEQAMREQDQLLADNARRSPLPERSSLREGERFEAVVLEVVKKHAIVGLGTHRGIVPLSWTDWAYKPDPERSWRSREQDDLTRALQVGDVVTVRVQALDATAVKNLQGYEGTRPGLAAVRLVQAPELEGALFSYDLKTGGVLAMVGGLDIEKSEFNRAVQARRQVGSTFKPIVYAAAIQSRRFTAGSIVPDAPITLPTLEDKLWKPGNYSEEYLGNITLRRALALSKNSCTVRVINSLGVDPVLEMARKLGIESELQEDQSIALGSGSLTLVELSRAYSVFATYGLKVDPYFIEKVEDRDGKVLEQHTPQEHPQVLDATVAGITTWLLQEVATSGTAAATNALKLHVAGKTGTTNDHRDAWFVGYTPDVLTTAWVGYDTPASLGVSSTGGRIALPMWMEYMKLAVPEERDRPFPEIPGAVWASIDESTGQVARGGRSIPFLPGTVPENAGIEVGQTSAEDLLTRDF